MMAIVKRTQKTERYGTKWNKYLFYITSDIIIITSRRKFDVKSGRRILWNERMVFFVLCTRAQQHRVTRDGGKFFYILKLYPFHFIFQ